MVVHILHFTKHVTYIHGSLGICLNVSYDILNVLHIMITTKFTSRFIINVQYTTLILLIFPTRFTKCLTSDFPHVYQYSCRCALIQSTISTLNYQYGGNIVSNIVNIYRTKYETNPMFKYTPFNQYITMKVLD